MKAQERIINLLTVASVPLSGYQIGMICGLGSWRLYPALQKLEHGNIIKGAWEETDSFPRRRKYQLVR